MESLGEGVRLKLWVQPKASRSEVVGLYGEPPRLKLRIAAPPVDGEANEEVRRFLAKTLGLPKSYLRIERGAESKSKDVLIMGISGDEVRAKLAASADVDSF